MKLEAFGIYSFNLQVSEVNPVSETIVCGAQESTLLAHNIGGRELRSPASAVFLRRRVLGGRWPSLSRS